MIANPLGLRVDPNRPVREQIRESAVLGARGVVIDATGDLAPSRLSDTGRREMRHLLRSVDSSLIALHLPTRRAFDTTDQLDDRLLRADSAFAMAYELGARIVLARVGGFPPESEAETRGIFLHALTELGRRASHRGVRLAIETGADPGETVKTLLDQLDNPGLATSIDPQALLQNGHDPGLTIRSLGPWVAHAYASLPQPSKIHTFASRTAFPPGVLDWEEYLGSFEEVGYRGFLTIWPDPARETAGQFKAIVERLRAL